MTGLPARAQGQLVEQIADINPTGDALPGFLTVFGDWLYFVAHDDVTGPELWRSNGETTQMVADINPTEGGTPAYLTVFDGWLYFCAQDGTHGSELCRSDGVTTEMVVDLNPGGHSCWQPFGGLEGWLYFRADDGTTGIELWALRYAASPEDELTAIVDGVLALDLSPGIQNALLVKLEQALDNLESGDVAAAIDHLRSFLQQVRAQRGSHLSWVGGERAR